MNNRSTRWAAMLALIPGLAVAAGGGPLPAAKHDPVVFLDFGSAWLNVVGYDNDYSVNGSFRVYGAGSQKDRLRMEWKSRGKLVGAAACATESYHERGRTLTAQCSLEKHAIAVGPIDVNLVYVDDQNDAEYLVNTLHVTVRSWKGIGKTQNWGMLPDDLLAAAFVRHWYGEASDTYYHTPLIEFWSTGDKLIGDAALRCTVDGKRLPDFDAHIDTAHASKQNEISFSVTNAKEHRNYLYRHYEVQPQVHFGTKAEHGLFDPDRVRWLIDNPGKWNCMLRASGHQIREFMFTVDEKGMVLPSAMQDGTQPLPTLSNVVLIDMKIPVDNGVERRIRPDAMRKSIGFGLAWPNGSNVKTIQAAFPPASGLSD